MHTELHNSYKNSVKGQQAADLIGACVHCGFCLATCPTYLNNRDERDSPRGRIYLIKSLLETGEASSVTHTHLDRCLSCRSCETTCPSGVRYGRILDIGRDLMEDKVPRSPAMRTVRSILRHVLSSPRLFGALLSLGQFFRPVLPGILKSKIPIRQKTSVPPVTLHVRSMLLLEGCIQRSASPDTNAAARRVLSKLGVSLNSIAKADCCGAINYHLAAQGDGLDEMRRNVDAWWPQIEAGTEAIVSTASGCGAMLVEYGELLAGDPEYAEKARRVSELSRDISEVLLEENLEELNVHQPQGRVAVHTPCTLQHALKKPGIIKEILERTGFTLSTTTEDHLCCGSAGTYSLLQAEISGQLRDNKLRALCGDQPDIIATGNIGCELQLAGNARLPVVHWLTLLDPEI